MKKLFLFLFFFSSLAFSQKFQLDWNDDISIIAKKMKKVGATKTDAPTIFKGGKLNAIPVKTWGFVYENDSLKFVTIEPKFDERLIPRNFYNEIVEKLSRSSSLGEPLKTSEDAYFWKLDPKTIFIVSFVVDEEKIKISYLRTIN